MTCTRELIVKRLEESPATMREIVEDIDSALTTVHTVLKRMRRRGEVNYTVDRKGKYRAMIFHLNGEKSHEKF